MSGRRMKLPEGESTKAHKSQAPATVRVALVTCSSSRFEKMKRGERFEDPSGDLIVKELSEAGHRIIRRQLVPNERTVLHEAIAGACRDANVDAVIVSGGTGVSSRDMTVEVAQELFDKEIKGFGELFRYLSYLEIGAAAIVSRAIAGTHSGKIIFCLPGSVDANRLAVTRLIIPEIGHLVGHIREQ
ncbi:MAG: MogA/MoaB family molybdenum cofactor biosynthesis protein [archaeon]